jgi:hypothetical protein
MNTHKLVPFAPDDPIQLPDGPLYVFVCTECGIHWPDPKTNPFTDEMAKGFIETWGWDCRECDAVKRAHALGLPGTQRDDETVN